MTFYRSPHVRVHVAFESLGPDEREVLALIAERLVKGRQVYGELNVATDKRDMVKETLEEAADQAVYATIGLMKAGAERAYAEDLGHIVDGRWTYSAKPKTGYLSYADALAHVVASWKPAPPAKPKMWSGYTSTLGNTLVQYTRPNGTNCCWLAQFDDELRKACDGIQGFMRKVSVIHRLTYRDVGKFITHPHYTTQRVLVDIKDTPPYHEITYVKPGYAGLMWGANDGLWTVVP